MGFCSKLGVLSSPTSCAAMVIARWHRW